MYPLYQLYHPISPLYPLPQIRLFLHFLTSVRLPERKRFLTRHHLPNLPPHHLFPHRQRYERFAVMYLQRYADHLREDCGGAGGGLGGDT